MKPLGSTSFRSPIQLNKQSSPQGNSISIALHSASPGFIGHPVLRNRAVSLHIVHLPYKITRCLWDNSKLKKKKHFALLKPDSSDESNSQSSQRKAFNTVKSLQLKPPRSSSGFMVHPQYTILYHL